LFFFLFFFYLKIKNGDENVFGWISVFIFYENIFSNEPKIKIIKYYF